MPEMVLRVEYKAMNATQGQTLTHFSYAFCLVGSLNMQPVVFPSLALPGNSFFFDATIYIIHLTSALMQLTF